MNQRIWFVATSAIVFIGMTLFTSCGSIFNPDVNQATESDSGGTCATRPTTTGIDRSPYSHSMLSGFHEIVLDNDGKIINIATAVGGDIAVAEVSSGEAMQVQRVGENGLQKAVHLGPFSPVPYPSAWVSPMVATLDGGVRILWPQAAPAGSGRGTDITLSHVTRSDEIESSYVLDSLSPNEPWLYAISTLGMAIIGHASAGVVTVSAYAPSGTRIWTDHVNASSEERPSITTSGEAVFLLADGSLTSWSANGVVQGTQSLGNNWAQIAEVRSPRSSSGSEAGIVLWGQTASSTCFLTSSGNPIGYASRQGAPFGRITGLGGQNGFILFNRLEMIDAESQSLISYDANGTPVNEWLLGSSEATGIGRTIVAVDRTDTGSLVLAGSTSEGLGNDRRLVPTIWVFASDSEGDALGGIARS